MTVFIGSRMPLNGQRATDPVKVRDALEKTSGLKLMHSPLTMDAVHNPKGKTGVLVEAKDGEFVYFKKITPKQ